MVGDLLCLSFLALFNALELSLLSPERVVLADIYTYN